MNKRNLLVMVGAVALGLVLMALPARSARQQKPGDSTIARLQQRIDELQAKLQAQLENGRNHVAELADADALEESGQAVVIEDQDPTHIEVLPSIENDQFNMVFGDDGSSWLGVETHEVTADKAKELKLSAERGVVLGKIVPDSPAAKAGLKENDVVTEINGQLGAFFGAPDGEGILVRDVNSGSAAEKAGVKAGDVIVSLNGERIRSAGELREKLSAKREDKDRTVKLGVLRNKSEVSLTVELPAPAAHTKRLVSRRTSI